MSSLLSITTQNCFCHLDYASVFLDIMNTHKRTALHHTTTLVASVPLHAGLQADQVPVRSSTCVRCQEEPESPDSEKAPGDSLFPDSFQMFFQIQPLIENDFLLIFDSCFSCKIDTFLCLRKHIDEKIVILYWTYCASDNRPHHILRSQLPFSDHILIPRYR